MATALDDGDDLAVQPFETAIETLGVAVGSTTDLLDLDLVVVGGGFAEKLGTGLAERIANAAAPWVLRPSPDLRFVVPELEDDAGAVGAAWPARAGLVTG